MLVHDYLSTIELSEGALVSITSSLQLMSEIMEVT